MMRPLFFIRSAGPRDFTAMMRLAKYLNSYNLPAERRAVRRLLADSESSFRGGSVPTGRRRFVFVAEHAATGQVVGTSLIIARHGTPSLPHLSFELGTETKHSRTTDIAVKHQTLRLKSDTSGFTEAGGLVVLPAFRGLGEKVGKQLSWARFAYLARRPDRFRPRILVEYLPPLDPKTGNKLWDGIGKRFTGLSYGKADRLSAANKEFILSLFPREKIYARLLGEEAAGCLGTAGPGAEASRRMLEKIGFKFLRQVDPFDGGPHYGAALKKISVIRRTLFAKFHRAVPAEKTGRPGRNRWLVMAETRSGVRACLEAFGKTRPRGVGGETARLLGLRGGEKISFTPFDE